MNPVAAERTLLFFVCLYWVLFGCTFLRLLLILFDVWYRKVSTWTHAKTIHATIVSALFARAIHLTLLHFVDEGRNLFISTQDEDLLFKVLSSVPGHILITIYSLLALLWLSILVRAYDVSPLLIPKRITLFGKSYDSSSSTVLKQNLKVACTAFNAFLYATWLIFFFLLWRFQESDTVYSVQSIFTAAIGVILAVLFGLYWIRGNQFGQQRAILSVEKLHLSKRILILVVLCSIVFLIKFPFVVVVSVSHTPWLTSFSFDLITYTLLEIIPFLVILILIGGKKVEEMGATHESAKFSFSFRKYNTYN
eukprot:Phypoly_transcript_12371.p1 GENE.Phypoly_transcript_12371~~Phypoly_transcript_12371.p1  ORF type:complete len:308 (+),score=16.19 Phypoly_transcript_12371:66-989(+)